MPTRREILNKITSIKNIQKITRAMELVAASKMRHAQLQMRTSRPYAEKIRQVIRHIAMSHTEYKHPFLQQRETIKRVGFIAISTDRGLCGGLNVNLFKATVQAMEDWRKKNVEIDTCTIGHKAEIFFRRFGANIIAHAEHLGDAPSAADLIGAVKIMLDAYSDNRLDALYLCFNEFINTMTQQPRIEKLLAIDVLDDATTKVGYWDYIYEPDEKELLCVLLVRHIETQVYQAVVENIACEQASRMVAMKSATDSANDLINGLQLDFNKVRQAAITREIAEITAGAEAIL